MNGLFGVNTREYEEKLNYLYFHDHNGYSRCLQKVKDAGYKVMRNPTRKHKVQLLL